MGYLSGDLHMHAVGLLIPELLELHDRSRFEVWAFDWTPESETPQRQRLRAAMDRQVRLSGVGRPHRGAADRRRPASTCWSTCRA
jgi:predicted O-linked N-acetylglucosamine transferase (SPINDLY family)